MKGKELGLVWKFKNLEFSRIFFFYFSLLFFFCSIFIIIILSKVFMKNLMNKRSRLSNTDYNFAISLLNRFYDLINKYQHYAYNMTLRINIVPC